jgi:hypothetical protein
MSDTRTDIKKFSQFARVDEGPVDVVGLKGGDNVIAKLTTDLVETNPDVTFRDAKGRFRSTKDFEELTNQLKVNRFIAEEIDLINAAIANLQAGSVVVADDPPTIEADGQLWLDSSRLELFVSYQDGWISTTPLAARVEAGEALQAQILARVEAGEAVQASITEAVDDGIREQTRLRSRIGDVESKVDQRLFTHPLWTYMGNDVAAENLLSGQFTLRHEDGGNPKLKIYLHYKDNNNRKWFGGAGGSAFDHNLGAQFVSITDKDGECRMHGKMTSATFNNGGNNYARLYLEYSKTNYSLTIGNSYTINVPGLLPAPIYHYSYERTGSRSVEDDKA